MISQNEMFLRLLLGAALGGIIGFERERHGRAAGLRTNMAVCMASVLIMLISVNFYNFLDLLNLDYIRIDPGRIAAGAITGVGFLGAGVIVRSGATVHGLTSAAIIWIVSIIGLTVGAGMYLLSILTTALTVATLVVLRMVEKRIKGDIYKELLVSSESLPRLQEDFDALLTARNVTILSVDQTRDLEQREMTFHYILRSKDEKTLTEIMDEVSARSGVRRVQLISRDR